MEFSLYAAIRFPLRLLSYSGCFVVGAVGAYNISNNNVTRWLVVAATFPWRFQCRTKNKVKRVANSSANCSVAEQQQSGRTAARPEPAAITLTAAAAHFGVSGLPAPSPGPPGLTFTLYYYTFQKISEESVRNKN